MHTEGSVIFADADVFDSRNKFRKRWRWDTVKELLDPTNAEPCISMLLTLFDPILSDNKKLEAEFDLMDFLSLYFSNANTAAKEFSRRYSSLYDGFTVGKVSYQLIRKTELIATIESFLMANWDIDAREPDEIAGLVEQTLAYFLATEDRREQLKILFVELASNISQLVPMAERRRTYGRTLYGVHDAVFLDEWVRANSEQLYAASDEQLLGVLWPLFEKYIKNTSFQACAPASALVNLVNLWVEGVFIRGNIRCNFCLRRKTTLGNYSTP